jgi:hypothetical protein
MSAHHAHVDRIVETCPTPGALLFVEKRYRALRDITGRRSCNRECAGLGQPGLSGARRFATHGKGGQIMGSDYRAALAWRIAGRTAHL